MFGTIGYGDSYLHYFFCRSKVIWLHAKVHDAAGAVRPRSGKSPGYCYMIGRGPVSCLLGHVTGLHLCLYVKLLLVSIFNSVNFCSSMSCIVLDVELAGKNHLKKVLEFLLLGLFRDTHYVSQKSTKPTNQTVWCLRNWYGLLWNGGRFDYSEFPSLLPIDLEREHFA